jgi:hypothetical protein
MAAASRLTVIFPTADATKKSSQFRLHAQKTWHKLIVIGFERDRFKPQRNHNKRRQA